MISLLCPSRNRPELLKKSLDSLGRGDYELLVLIDTDEPQLEAYKEIAKDSRVSLYKTPRHTYEKLHEYYNFLAAKAKGDWLMLWNDDALMETGRWTRFVEGYDPSQLVVLSIFHEVNNLFPTISRKFYEIIGHFGLQTHVDSWVQLIGERTATQHFVSGYTIIHDKPSDETGRESSRIAADITGSEFGLEKYQRLIEVDMGKITKWMEENDVANN